MQLSKEKNQIANFAQDSSFYTIHKPHTTKGTRILLTSRFDTNMVGNSFFSMP